MSSMQPNHLNRVLALAFAVNTQRLSHAMARELEKPIDLEGGRHFQFEVDPYGYRISCCATEKDLLPDDWLEDAVPADWQTYEGAEEWDNLIWKDLPVWVAECWQRVNGPSYFRAALLFFHGYQHEQFDLEQRRWVSADQAFNL